MGQGGEAQEVEGEPGALEAWGQKQGGGKERSPGAGVRPGERMGTTALGLAAMRPKPAEQRGRLYCKPDLVHEGVTLPKMEQGLAVHAALASHVLLWRWEHFLPST